MKRSSRKLSLVNQVGAEGTSVRIAFATSDNVHVNQHFGSSVQFAIYELRPQSWQLIELSKFDRFQKGHDQKKIQIRLDSLNQCVAIFCNAIGPTVIHQLLALKIMPETTRVDTEIKSTLRELLSVLQKDPKHWLSRRFEQEIKKKDGIKKRKNKQRLASLLNEDWE